MKIINLDIHDDIINFTSDYVLKSKKNTAIISGGKRPFLFIKKKLALKRNKPFFPPKFFTNDEFVEEIIFNNTKFVKISDLEAAFIIFEIIKKNTPSLLNNQTSFASFIDWAFEILFFIEQLDLENVCDEKIKTVMTNAEIGYDVPNTINDLLKNIFKIRNNFHDILDNNFKITKGYSLLKATFMNSSLLSCNFDEIILIAPFYLHKTEIEIFNKIGKIGKLTIFTQGNPNDYGILSHLYSAFNVPLPNIKIKKDDYKLNIYSTFDDQSQGSLLKNLIKNYSKEELNNTVIIVPDPKILQSITSEISIVTGNYNVSIGYPAEKTSVFCLLNAIVKAQLSKKDQYYYSKDIINVLTNPLVKNMRFFGENSISRIIAHKIEEFLDVNSKSNLKGRAFVSFNEIINNEQLINEISITISQAWEYISQKKILGILKDIFYYFFILWENIDTFSRLSDVLNFFLKKIYLLSAVSSYYLNIEAMELLLNLSKEFKFCEISTTKFYDEEIFDILKKIIKNKKISLFGSSLNGVQILGFLESRNLFFKNVFIVSMIESSIPAIKKEYSLIPKNIMFNLGIEMAKKEFEIQKYHFDRLIAKAKNLNFIYPDNGKDERSRFIESIIWNKQFENKDIDAIRINKFVLSNFFVKRHNNKRKYTKTKKINEYLKNMVYTYSKIDTYLNCRLKFYFRYILLLKSSIKIGSELSSGDIGDFIHGFLKIALHKNLDFNKIQSLKFEKEYLNKFENSFNNFSNFKFREDTFMIKEVLVHKMMKVLHNERKRSYKVICESEKEYFSNIKTDFGNIYKLGCRIDRVDNCDENYAILDYKTGSINDFIISKKYFSLLYDNFDRQNIKKAIKSLQLPLYKYIYENETGFTKTECAIYDIKNIRLIEFPKQKEIYDKCICIIKSILDDINLREEFEFDSKDKVDCKSCMYFYICR
ncbi:MAG: PD-(D/E)XK nuclease family protein [Endomicrobium sp.]|jgi:hypothetical protein|nr:PD-(D/E)XK nuclease family protein [Endomicrobium sp.]